MLSYKHGFHAGNYADVLKHLCWLAVIRHLNKKNKPFTLYDTHSGAGLYALNDATALKTREFESGIGLLQHANSTDPLLSDYLSLIQPYQQAYQYPGSPVIAMSGLREQDAMHLFELHPSEYAVLKGHTKSRKQVHPHYRDGFEGLLALAPPSNQRGAVLIDPPYEQQNEYKAVIDTVTALYQRWQNAQVLVWYPKLSSRAGDKSGASERMVDTLCSLSKPVYCIELCTQPNTPDAGMYGTGVCVINPPWQFDRDIEAAMQDAMAVFGDHATLTGRWLNPPE
ncbi:23S rRNA (adenine(2030)-N(6))-methyltransferase RlmJ [Alteromonas sp. CYL-A6]|uniref:23S rRNA (adenine(2030)-N(6))-methyltransferase RlmJ n=1 Tax=Alteromonas nitratireducens TaxID=3390813 RepID=UPI0034AF7BB6